MDKPRNDAKLVNDIYTLSLWFLRKIPGISKAYRFSLAEKVQAHLLEALHLGTMAYYSRQNRKENLEKLNALLEELRLLSRLCMDLKILTPDQHAFFCRELGTIGRQVGGFLRKASQRKESHASKVDGYRRVEEYPARTHDRAPRQT